MASDVQGPTPRALHAICLAAKSATGDMSWRFDKVAKVGETGNDLDP